MLLESCSLRELPEELRLPKNAAASSFTKKAMGKQAQVFFQRAEINQCVDVGLWVAILENSGNCSPDIKRSALLKQIQDGENGGQHCTMHNLNK